MVFIFTFKSRFYYFKIIFIYLAKTSKEEPPKTLTQKFGKIGIKIFRIILTIFVEIDFAL